MNSTSREQWLESLAPTDQKLATALLETAIGLDGADNTKKDRILKAILDDHERGALVNATLRVREVINSEAQTVRRKTATDRAWARISADEVFMRLTRGLYFQHALPPEMLAGTYAAAFCKGRDVQDDVGQFDTPLSWVDWPVLTDWVRGEAEKWVSHPSSECDASTVVLRDENTKGQ
jgi:hypothetical protein